MTQKEKAELCDKAYDKVAARFGLNVAKEIFTDLYESEDEKIKKDVYNYLYNERHNIRQLTPYTDELDRWLAWLEKQESVGEIVERCKKSWYNEGKIAGMAEGLTDDEKYQQGWHDALEKQGEQKPMTEEFEHELAEICNQLLSEIDSEWMNNEILDCIGTSVWLNLCDETAKRYKDGLLKLAKQGEQKPAEWGEEDETTFKVMLEELEKYVMFKQYSTPLSVYDLQWFKSLKDRVQPQPKQEWSVEDETGWTNTMIMIKEVASNHYTKDSINLVVNWLKSLKQRIGG